MALPTGEISLVDIAEEFNDELPHELTEFYGTADGIPASGRISMGADFRGKSAQSAGAVYNFNTKTLKMTAMF